MPSPEEQLKVIRRGVEQIVPEEELLDKLRRCCASGKPLRVKYGIDPTGIDVHLGHTVPLRKLRQFQELGHQAVVIIGNYTALVGDPSGRDETRARLTPEDVQRNARDYLKQVAKVVDLDSAEVVHNGDWFSRMSFADILSLTSKMTVARLLERDDFTKRMKAERAIYLHECLYPLMQGWDSVQVRADVELGGSEQLFSLLVARDLQRDADQEPQVAITFPILVGTDGHRRMGKSLGNYIGVADPPEEMYGKLMSIPDEAEQDDGRMLNVIRQYFELLTDVPLNEVNALLAPDKNPRDAKAELARTIVAEFHGSDWAKWASSDFERKHRKRELPEDKDIELVNVDRNILTLRGDDAWLPSLLSCGGLANSNSDARRLIEQGAVKLGREREVVTDINTYVPISQLETDPGLLVSVGRRRFAWLQVYPKPTDKK